jgi:NADH:ubiquinone oxidoreductase subunit C
MFESLRGLIDSRLGIDIVRDDFVNNEGFFIKIFPSNLYSVAFFLKNDPDVRLTLFDQIIALPTGVLCWPSDAEENNRYEILYQLRSLKLPYRVSLVIDLPKDNFLPSIAPLYAGARWQEADLCERFDWQLEEVDRR